MGGLNAPGLAFEERGWPVIRALKEIFGSLLLFSWSCGLGRLLLIPFLFFVEFQRSPLSAVSHSKHSAKRTRGKFMCILRLKWLLCRVSAL